MVSVITLTKNEEQDLPGCLASLAWCSDIHVVDSGSSDRTVEIARAHGATVWTNPFTSFGQQRNWATDHCALKNDWILFLDADERSTPEFEGAVVSAIGAASPEVAGFYCCWKMMLGDRWLKRSDNFPKWQFRLFRKGRARFIDVGHGQKEGAVEGRIEYLREPYLHYAFSRGWEVWTERHRRNAGPGALVRRSFPGFARGIFADHGNDRGRLRAGEAGRLAVIFDTNGVSAFFNGLPEVVKSVAGAPRVLLPGIVVGEYRDGLLSSREP